MAKALTSGTKTDRRQARLRREYAPWYPTLSVTGWVPAATVARAVARQLVQGEPRWAPRWEVGPRLLDERHFMFRGGIERDGLLRTRLNDGHQGNESPGAVEGGSNEASSL
jgi:hypothetical protein